MAQSTNKGVAGLWPSVFVRWAAAWMECELGRHFNSGVALKIVPKIAPNPLIIFSRMSNPFGYSQLDTEFTH